MLITVKTLPWYETYPETPTNRAHSFYITPDLDLDFCAGTSLVPWPTRAYRASRAACLRLETKFNSASSLSAQLGDVNYVQPRAKNDWR